MTIMDLPFSHLVDNICRIMFECDFGTAISFELGLSTLLGGKMSPVRELDFHLVNF